ncbi:MAG TPA: TonB-dependent receptor [Rhizomicrobium sp.]|nr:TonB-dependent receptor [Rhizomicrobium sp.]
MPISNRGRRGNLRRAILAGASLCGLAAISSPVAAQNQQVAAASTDNSNIETVMVTARKTSERLIDVPVAANVLSDATLQRYVTSDLTTVGLQVPQVSIDHAASGSGAQITVRGVGSTSVDAGIEQEVTVNIDGIPVSRGRVIQSSIFDLQSVEVLKGPQSLYFGKNSPAGVIVLDSADPDSDFNGYVRTGYETTTETVYGETAVSIPVTDDFGIRLAFRGSDMMGGTVSDVGAPITPANYPNSLPVFLALSGTSLPGAVQHMLPGDQDYNGRASFKWTPTDQLEMSLKVLVGDHNDLGDSMDQVLYNCGSGQTNGMSEDYGRALLDEVAVLGGHAPPYANVFLSDPYSSCGDKKRQNSFGTIPASVAAHYPGSNGGIPFTDIPTELVSLTTDYKVTNNLTLTNVVGYYEYDETQWSNYDFTDMTMASGQNDEHYKQWTEELRFASSFDFPVNFTGGFFYDHSNRHFVQSGAVGYLPADVTTGQLNDFGANSYYTDETISLFGEGRWKIADNLELAGGARWTKETVTGDELSTYVNSTFALFDAALPEGQSVVGSQTAYNVSPQATLTWHPTSDMMFYAAYKQGFKSGGFSTPALIPYDANAENQSFKPETAKGYEIGTKFSQLNGSLTGDITAYHYAYYDLQQTAFNAATTSYYIQNVCCATTQGVEANLNYLVMPGLTARADAGYNDAHYNQFANAACWADQSPTQGCIGAAATGDPLAPYTGGVQNLGGRPLDRAPKWTGNVGFSYDTPVTPMWNVGVTGDLHVSGGYYLYSSDSPYGYQGSYTTVDASARLYNDSWEFALVGRNLTDAYYAVLGDDKPLGPVGQVNALLGDPREIFLQISYHY